MITITERQADILYRYVQGQTGTEISKDCGITVNTVCAMARVLRNKGLLKKVGHGHYELTDVKFEIVKTPVIERTLVKVSPEVLEYVRGHYSLYRNKRGVLAKRLGITRTLLNQIVIDHLGGESA